MKAVFLSIFLAVVFSVNAQTDTIVGVLIEPVISTHLSGRSDTAVSLNWVANNVTRESGKPCNLNITLHDRKGKILYSFEQVVPANVVDSWGSNNTIIDNYLFSITRFKRKK